MPELVTPGATLAIVAALAYLLGSVLERFFRRQVTINSFTETVLTSVQRGEIARWKPEAGLGRII